MPSLYPCLALVQGVTLVCALVTMQPKKKSRGKLKVGKWAWGGGRLCLTAENKELALYGGEGDTYFYHQGLHLCDAGSPVVGKAVWGLLQTLVRDTLALVQVGRSFFLSETVSAFCPHAVGHDDYPFGQAAAFLWCQGMIYWNTLHSHSMDLEASKAALPRAPRWASQTTVMEWQCQLWHSGGPTMLYL